MSSERGIRIHEIDILKGFAICSVVLGHACNCDVFYGTLANEIRKFVYIYNLSVFFFCTGYLYKARTVRDFVKKI